MTDDLKSCPFCGRDAECLHIYAGEEIVRCENEGCHVRPCLASDDMDTSMALWNQRAESDTNSAAEEGGA